MSTMKIKKGDTVKVIAGKDKDKEGKVLSVDKKNGRVVVEGVSSTSALRGKAPCRSQKSSQTTRC